MIHPANRVHILRLVNVNYVWAFPSKVASYSLQKLPVLVKLKRVRGMSVTVQHLLRV